MDLRQELPYRVDYAYYGQNEEQDYCNGCHGAIEEDSLRFAVESHINFRNRVLIWHHFSCFFDRFRPRIQEMSHFAQLKYSDQKRIRRAIKRSLIQAFSDMSDVSSDDNINDSNNTEEYKPKKKKKKIRNPEEIALKSQSDLFYKNLRFLETMKFKDLTELMKYNNIDIPLKWSSKCDRLADAMTFGRLLKCPECKKGQLVFRICGYICSGYAHEIDKKKKWFRCGYQTTDKPQRKAFKISKQLSLKYDFLKQYKYERRDRIYIPSLVRSNQQMIQNNSSEQSDQ